MKTYQELVQSEARAWLGTPYVHQASSRGNGADCLGFVRGVWRSVEGKEPQSIPAYSSTWADPSGREDLLAAMTRFFHIQKEGPPQIGDVLLFRMRRNSPAKHLGILTSKDWFTHAYEAKGVVETQLCEFWKSKLVVRFVFPCLKSERFS